MARLKFRKILGSVSYQQGLLISLLLPSVHRRPSQSPAAFRTVLKILFCLISAISAFFPGLIGSAVVIAPAAPLLNQRQVGTFYICLLAVKQRLSHLRVQLIDSITAGHFYIKSLIPLEQGNKEKAEIHIGHVNLVSPVSAAPVTDHGLHIIQDLPSLADSSYEYHIC